VEAQHSQTPRAPRRAVAEGPTVHLPRSIAPHRRPHSRPGPPTNVTAAGRNARRSRPPPQRHRARRRQRPNAAARLSLRAPPPPSLSPRAANPPAADCPLRPPPSLSAISPAGSGRRPRHGLSSAPAFRRPRSRPGRQTTWRRAPAGSGGRQAAARLRAPHPAAAFCPAPAGSYTGCVPRPPKSSFAIARQARGRK